MENKEQIEDNASKFIDDPFGNRAQFIDNNQNNEYASAVKHSTETARKLEVTLFIQKLKDSINSLINQNSDVDWDKVISYAQQIELMAEAMKSNDFDTVHELSSQEINVMPDYSIENIKQFK